MKVSADEHVTKTDQVEFGAVYVVSAIVLVIEVNISQYVV